MRQEKESGKVFKNELGEAKLPECGSDNSPECGQTGLIKKNDGNEANGSTNLEIWTCGGKSGEEMQKNWEKKSECSKAQHKKRPNTYLNKWRELVKDEKEEVKLNCVEDLGVTKSRKNYKKREKFG